MTEKEYKILLSKLKKDLKPVISAYVKKEAKKRIKETLETLKEFDFLNNNSYEPQRKPQNESLLPPKYSNSDKLKTVRKNLKVGRVDVPIDVPQQQPTDPSQTDYSNFLDKVEEADNKKKKR